MKKILLSALVFVFLFTGVLSANASVVYNSLPSPLPPNTPSQPFQAQQTFEFGDYVHLGGTDRNLTTVTVGMSDWALYSDYTSDVRYNTNSATWSHPITINIYSNHLGVNGVPDTLLATKTQNIDIPWRPVGDPSCPDTGYGLGFAWKASDNNCYNGFAFNATFDLSSLNVTLPNDVIVSLAYNTQTYGAAPIGSNGPYNSLNVLVPNNQSVSIGSDDSNNEVFWNTSTAGWYADGGSAGVNTFRKDTGWSPNGTVAMQINAVTPLPATCPVGTTQSTSLETINVNSASVNSVSSVGSLLNGQQYLLVSSGTWMNSLNASDTEYTSLDNWTSHMNGYDINPYFLGEGEFDLQVNNSFVNWGAYNSGHSYSYLYTGTGSQINLGIFDGDSNTNTKNLGWYGDNSGSLTVDVYSCMPNIKYVKGGGNYKVGNGKTATSFWTFGGNVWTNGGSPVGQFELVNHITGTNYHFTSFSNILSSNGGKTLDFDASGMTQGKTKLPVTGVHFKITDNGEPGKSDSIIVSGGSPAISLTAIPITGGNFQVSAQ